MNRLEKIQKTAKVFKILSLIAMIFGYGTELESKAKALSTERESE